MRTVLKILEDFSRDLAQGALVLSVTTLEDITEYAKKRGRFYTDNDFVMLKEALRYAWNYDEAYRREYTFEEAIKWFKSYAPKDASADGCLLLEKRKAEPYMIHHCFISKRDEKPLLDGKHPHRLVKAQQVSNELLKNFGDKNMLIIR